MLKIVENTLGLSNSIKYMLNLSILSTTIVQLQSFISRSNLKDFIFKNPKHGPVIFTDLSLYTYLPTYISIQ